MERRGGKWLGAYRCAPSDVSANALCELRFLGVWALIGHRAGAYASGDPKRAAIANQWANVMIDTLTASIRTRSSV
jgi:hypothetical protein